MTPHQNYRQSKNILADSFSRQTTEDSNLLMRGGVVPLGEYSRGVGFAWPEFIASPARSINNLLRNGYRTGDAEAVGDVTNALLSTMMIGGRPLNSIGAGGRPRIPFTEDQEQKMLRMIYDGIPLARIAKELGVSHPTVSRRYREYGIEARGGGAPGSPRALPMELDEQLAKARLNGVPIEKLASDYGVDRGTVSNALRRWRDRNPDRSDLPTLRQSHGYTWDLD